jgi:hypothetical protein
VNGEFTEETTDSTDFADFFFGDFAPLRLCVIFFSVNATVNGGQFDQTAVGWGA